MKTMFILLASLSIAPCFSCQRCIDNDYKKIQIQNYLDYLEKCERYKREEFDDNVAFCFTNGYFEGLKQGVRECLRIIEGKTKRNESEK